MVSLEIGFDESDNVMRQLLLDMYDTVMCCNDDRHWQHPDDIAYNAELLHAISVLMDYISVGDDGKKALEAIHDKHRYSSMISKMGNKIDE